MPCPNRVFLPKTSSIRRPPLYDGQVCFTRGVSALRDPTVHPHHSPNKGTENNLLSDEFCIICMKHGSNQDMGKSPCCIATKINRT